MADFDFEAWATLPKPLPNFMTNEEFNKTFDLVCPCKKTVLLVNNI
jgi:hypothetical protein